MRTSIRKTSADGDRWAWFCAKVTASWEGHSASDYLGGCSYESEEDFRKDDYFQDLCDRALEELNEQIAAEAATLDKLRVPA